MEIKEGVMLERKKEKGKGSKGGNAKRTMILSGGGNRADTLALANEGGAGGWEWNLCRESEKRKDRRGSET